MAANPDLIDIAFKGSSYHKAHQVFRDIEKHQQVSRALVDTLNNFLLSFQGDSEKRQLAATYIYAIKPHVIQSIRQWEPHTKIRLFIPDPGMKNELLEDTQSKQRREDSRSRRKKKEHRRRADQRQLAADEDLQSELVENEQYVEGGEEAVEEEEEAEEEDEEEHLHASQAIEEKPLPGPPLPAIFDTTAMKTER